MAAFHPAGLDQRMLIRVRRLDLHPGAALGVAFSGGNDSLALAIALARCSNSADMRPVLMHIDHRLRPESGDDVARCVELAEHLGLPIRTDALDPDMADRARGSGIEQQARLERYEALSRLCGEIGADVLATGHHQGDQAETVLLHLFRGAGLGGVAGMRNISPPPVSSGFASEFSPLLVWRPFLEESRSNLEAYVASSGLHPVVDSTNEEPAFRRNAVRHEILPTIERHFPGAVEAIGRFAGLVQEDADLLDRQARDAIEMATTSTGSVEIGSIQALPGPIASRVVRLWLQDAGVDEPTAERSLAVIRFAGDGTEESHLEVGSGLWVVRRAGNLLVGEPDDLVRQVLGNREFLVCADAEDVEASDVGSDMREFRGPAWTVQIWEDGARLVPTREHSALMQIRIPLSISLADIAARPVRPGDRWLATHESVREVLRKAGVHPIARRRIVCLAVDGEVLAIPGYSAEQRGPVGMTSAGSRVIHISWQSKERSA